MEKIINTQVVAYLEGNDLLSDSRQYRFRIKRSAGDLLVHGAPLWGDAIEDHGEALTFSLEIAKTFDRAWHKALLTKLTSFGLPSKLCLWIADFLSGRSIQVIIDGFSSVQKSINTGVPQGSVLPQTLFLLFINDLLGLGRVICYADDSTVFAVVQSSC